MSWNSFIAQVAEDQANSLVFGGPRRISGPAQHALYYPRPHPALPLPLPLCRPAPMPPCLGPGPRSLTWFAPARGP